MTSDERLKQLEEIEKHMAPYPPKKRTVVRVDDYRWLLTEFRKSLEVEQVAVEALTSMDYDFPADVPYCDYNRGMKLSHDISRNTTRTALTRIAGIKRGESK